MKTKKFTYDWNERGSDERQFCAPFVDLPVSSVMRSKYMEYPEYHTSLDKIGTVVTNKGLIQSINFYKKVIDSFENLYFPVATKICEPFMTKYKLYSTIKNKSSDSICPEGHSTHLESVTVAAANLKLVEKILKQK